MFTIFYMAITKDAHEQPGGRGMGDRTWRFHAFSRCTTLYMCHSLHVYMRLAVWKLSQSSFFKVFMETSKPKHDW